jgi:hypothetical protein
MKSFYNLIFCILFLTLNSGCSKDKVGDNPPFLGVECSDSISFSKDVLPIIQNHCTGCHDNSNGYTFTNYENISSQYIEIVGSMKENGYQLMPKGENALPDSTIQKIQCWVNQGLRNN